MRTLLALHRLFDCHGFYSQAFAMDLPDCPKGTWKHRRYVCGDIQANS
jgi:hypothetical protein